MADALWSTGFTVIDDFADRGVCAGLVDVVNDYRDRHHLPYVERRTRGRDLRYEVIDGAHVACVLPMIDALLDETDRAVAERCGRPLVRLGGQAGVNVNIVIKGTLGSDRRASTSIAWTTRFVLVPISVHTPPRIAA